MICRSNANPVSCTWGFKILVNYLFLKFDMIREMFDTFEFIKNNHVFGVTESKLSATVPDAEVQIGGLLVSHLMSRRRTRCVHSIFSSTNLIEKSNFYCQ